MAPPTITKGMTLGLVLVGMFLCETAVAQTLVLYMFIKVHLTYLCLHQHVISIGSKFPFTTKYVSLLSKEKKALSLVTVIIRQQLTHSCDVTISM